MIRGLAWQAEPMVDGSAPFGASADVDPVPASDPRSSPPRPHRKGRIALWSVVGLLVVVVIAGFLVRLPYVIFSPGSATPVTGVVTVKGAPTYRHKGSILFLTVSVTTSRPSAWQVLAARLSSNDTIMSEHDYLGGLSRSQDQSLDVALMRESQESAKLVALRALGYTVPVHGAGAQVAGVVKGSPADGRLSPRDVITAVDGRTVGTADDLGRLVKARPVGSELDLQVLRDDKTITVSVPSVKAPAGAASSGKPFIGVEVTTRHLTIDYPVKITIDPGPVSGPSAGLAFSLTLVDELSPGNLTGGRTVAVTGTIDDDGNVGPVGGVRQKTAVARSAGATLFLVPVSETGQARHFGGSHMTVVGVRTLDDALRALHAHGGSPVEKVGAARGAAA